MGTFKQYFTCLENKIDIYNFGVLLLGDEDFNVAGVDWKLVLVSIIFHYNNTFKGEANMLPCV
jgi:hypothetical protein